MLGYPEIAYRAERHLADAIGRSVLLRVEQLPVLGNLAAAKYGPPGMLDRGLRDKGVVLVVLDRLASPRERSGELPPRRDFAGIERARRPTLLVDARLEL